jgi:multidrug efflux pump subunit AcrA (membrane-fusion protein)
MVKVVRTSDGQAVVSEGLAGNETVVTDGQLALRDRTLVEIRPARGS